MGGWYTGDGQTGGYAEGHGDAESRKPRKREASPCAACRAGLESEVSVSAQLPTHTDGRGGSSGCVSLSGSMSMSWLRPLRKLGSSTPTGATTLTPGSWSVNTSLPERGWRALEKGRPARLQLGARQEPLCQGVGKQGRGGGLSRGTEVSWRERPLVGSGTL